MIKNSFERTKWHLNCGIAQIIKTKATETPQATKHTIVTYQFHQSRAAETGPDCIRCFKTFLSGGFEAYWFIQMRMGAIAPGAQPIPCG